MKKLIFVAMLLLFVSGTRSVYAQEATGAASTEVLGVQTVDYTLPYPGLLPDNPLYLLKAFRDKLVGFLIADPIKKAEFNVLQADKRLEASWLLMQKKPLQEGLVVSTLAKAENYFSEGIDQATFAKKQGQETSDILGRMEMSNKKHIEIIEIMEGLSTPSLKGKITAQKERTLKLGKLVGMLQSKQ